MLASILKTMIAAGILIATMIATGTMIAPDGVPNIPCSTVAVKQTNSVNFAEPAALNSIANADEVGFKTVVVGGVTGEVLFVG